MQSSDPIAGDDPPAADHVAELEALAATNEIGWWHSIDLGGYVTPGYKSEATLAAELAALRLPDLKGRSVLDIGAWDGFFSFAAERLGAERVVALDHFVWSLHTPLQHEYVARCRARGERPQPFETVPEIWHPDTLPGKQGFDIAHSAIGSRVESVVGDFTTIDLEPLGRFDVVLFLGVLYHLKDPLGGLERLARLTRPGGVAVIETAAVFVPGHEDRALCEFYEADELNGDFTNWWAPNLRALVGLCRAAGFSRVETDAPEAPSAPEAPASSRFRGLLRRRRPGTAAESVPPPAPTIYRAYVRAHP